MDRDDHRALEWVNRAIADHPVPLVLGFLILTAVFAVGLGNVSTAAGTEQFAKNVPANRALEDVQREFGPRFGADAGSTQLIQRDRNVLSKDSLLAMLRAQHRLSETNGLRVTGTSSAARTIAQTIDPNATTLPAQIRTIEWATPGQIDRGVRSNKDDPAFTGRLSEDFNPTAAEASATIGVVRHDLPGGDTAGAGQGGTSPLTPIQHRAQRTVDTVDADITVFGSGIVAAEFNSVIGDSLLIVTPAAILFIVIFLTAAYRDPFDLALGVLALGMTAVWTFGFLGLAGIPFNQVMIAVPPLLLAVGIDFGIHAINRYREAREAGDHQEPGVTMTVATRQLIVAFFIVTGTTVIGFLSNLASDLPPIRDFGLVAAVGIVFTFLIFGIFVPAAKVLLERVRSTSVLPARERSSLATEGSDVGRLLRVGVAVARKAPVAVVLLSVLVSAGAGYYATGIDTSFSQEDFLPPAETAWYLASLPEPFRPGEYTVAAQLSFLESNFERAQSSSVTVYLERRMTAPTALESIHHAHRHPPDTILTRPGTVHARAQSIVSVIRSYAARDPEFARLVATNDRNGNGIPDRNLETVYHHLLHSPARDRALQYLARDYRSTRVIYDVDADASNAAITADGRTAAARYRGEATATGRTVVFEAISGLILESAVRALVIALGATVLFLVVVYWTMEGFPSLGVANVVPIFVSVAAIAGSMRFIGLAFNAVTATVLAITIGLGIDYSVHVVHRFIDERRDHSQAVALDRAVRGTGGALMGSMLTTVSGIGVLVLAVLSVLGQFGIITALSIVYSFLASMLVLPSALVVWDRIVLSDPSRGMSET